MKFVKMFAVVVAVALFCGCSFNNPFKNFMGRKDKKQIEQPKKDVEQPKTENTKAVPPVETKSSSTTVTNTPAGESSAKAIPEAAVQKK